MAKEEEIDKKKKKDKDDEKKEKKEKKKNKGESESSNSSSSPDALSKIAKTNSQPEIKVHEQPAPKEKMCYLHNHRIVHFCETCEEPICDKCILLGPHNNQVSIALEAFVIVIETSCIVLMGSMRRTFPEHRL